MADEEFHEVELSSKQKKEIAKWFLLNAPAGEIKYVAKDIKTILKDDDVYNEAAMESFPVYNKAHMIAFELADRSGDLCGKIKLIDGNLKCELMSGDRKVIVTSFGEISENEYLDPRTAKIAIIDHVKQVCTDVRDATDEELPSPYVEDFRCALDVEFMKYVCEAYPKGICSVYCVKGNDVEGPGSEFEFVLLISAVRHSPQNFCNGSWRSIWNVDFKDEEQTVEIKGKIQVGAHYFEEGNVQLDSDHECQDSTIFQSSEDSAVTITNIIRHHETEYLTSLEASYVKLPDTTFKELRRKLPVTRTLFPWHSTQQISLNRDLSKEIGSGK